MVRHTAYQPGTPSWADVSCPDLEAGRAFYGALFGWTGEPSPIPEARGYTVFMQGDAAVAGLGPTWGDMPAVWSTYVTVADVEEAVSVASAAGGQELHGAVDVFDAGRMAVIADPTGAALSLWQPGQHIGAEVRMESGTLCWAELNTRQPEVASAFYKTLFGWESHELDQQETGGDSAYHMLQLGDTAVGGIITMDDRWPAEVPSHWMVYFAVEDCEASSARVAELGGKVCVPPTDIAPGRFAVVEDPFGAPFTIIALNPELFG